MKTGVISDVHGNYPALKAVLAELDKTGCGSIICLGDICGYYPMVNECISALRDRGAVCLKGNHDSYLLGETQCFRSNTANTCIDYQRSIISEENKRWISNLNSELSLGYLEAVHAGWNDPLEEYLYEPSFASLLQRFPECRIFLSGHTHIQRLELHGCVTYCNPGSIGQPRDGDSRAAYAILDQGGLSLRRTPYDIDEIVAASREAGFSERVYENLYYGLAIGVLCSDASRR